MIIQQDVSMYTSRMIIHDAMWVKIRRYGTAWHYVNSNWLKYTHTKYYNVALKYAVFI